MKPRFIFDKSAVRFSNRIEWRFYDRLRADYAFLVFDLHRRVLEGKKSGTPMLPAPAWTDELEAALPPEQLAWAIALSITQGQGR